jgi:hypothetical protein
LLEVYVHCWLAWRLQSYSATRVPLACEAFGTSMHRPDCVPLISPAPVGGAVGPLGVGLLGPGLLGLGVAAFSALRTDV